MVYESVKGSDESPSLEWCKMWDGLSTVGSTVVIVAIQGTFALRVCALYRNSPYKIAFVGAIYISCYAFMLVLFPPNFTRQLIISQTRSRHIMSAFALVTIARSGASISTYPCAA